MRFVWLQEKSDHQVTVKQAYTHPLALIRLAYNVVFWVFLLPLTPFMDVPTGFIAFTIVIAVRLVLNLYTNNFLNLTPEQFLRYPFRIPA
jgi:hypothetical protein